MIRRTAEHPAARLRPGFQCLPARDQVAIRFRQLPEAIDVATVGRRAERHLLGVCSLVVVEIAGGCDRARESAVSCYVIDLFRIDIDGPTVNQRLAMVASRFHHSTSLACWWRAPSLCSLH